MLRALGEARGEHPIQAVGQWVNEPGWSQRFATPQLLSVLVSLLDRQEPVVVTPDGMYFSDAATRYAQWLVARARAQNAISGEASERYALAHVQGASDADLPKVIAVLSDAQAFALLRDAASGSELSSMVARAQSYGQRHAENGYLQTALADIARNVDSKASGGMTIAR